MPSNFIHQRHAAYQTPPALLFNLIKQTTGDDPSHSEKLVRGYDNEVYAVQTGQGHDYIVRIHVAGFYKLRPDGGWDFPDWASIDPANRRDRSAERPYLQQAGLQEQEIDTLLALILTPCPPIDRQPVLCHADLGFDHLFVDATLTIIGVIDFGEFQGGLPLVDFARLSLDCTEEELRWVQTGYANQALFADNFAQRLRLSRLNFLTGYLAHCVRIRDHEERQIVIDTLRAALSTENLA